MYSGHGTPRRWRRNAVGFDQVKKSDNVPAASWTGSSRQCELREHFCNKPHSFVMFFFLPFSVSYELASKTEGKVLQCIVLTRMQFPHPYFVIPATLESTATWEPYNMLALKASLFVMVCKYTKDSATLDWTFFFLSFFPHLRRYWKYSQDSSISLIISAPTLKFIKG